MCIPRASRDPISAISHLTPRGEVDTVIKGTLYLIPHQKLPNEKGELSIVSP